MILGANVHSDLVHITTAGHVVLADFIRPLIDTYTRPQVDTEEVQINSLDYLTDLGENSTVFVGPTNFVDSSTYAGNTNFCGGLNAGQSLTSGNRNIFINDAGVAATEAQLCVGLGKFALNALTTGDNHLGLGVNALNSVTTEDNNIGIGPVAGGKVGGSGANWR